LPQGQLVEVGDAEVRLRRGLEAVRLVPVEDLRQIHLEDLLLAERARRFYGEDRLLDLPGDRWLIAEEPGLDELLRDRRTTLRDTARREIHLERAHDPSEVDARVGPEAVILDRDRGVLHENGDLREGHELAALVLEGVEQVL